MPVDARIPLLGQLPQLSLDPFERSRARGLEYQRGLLGLQDEQRSAQEHAAVRQAYAAQYGGGGGAPGGLAGLAPQMTSGAPPGPVQERQRGGDYRRGVSAVQQDLFPAAGG